MKKIKQSNDLEEKRNLWNDALSNKEHSIYCNLHWKSDTAIQMAGKKKKKTNLHLSGRRAPSVLIFRGSKNDSNGNKIGDDTIIDPAELMMM